METNSLHDGERLRAFFKTFIPDRSRERMLQDHLKQKLVTISLILVMHEGCRYALSEVVSFTFLLYIDSFFAWQKIPSAFTSYMKGKLSPSAYIMDRYGTKWPVQVGRIEDDFFFLNGWAKFVKDNTVELGDFLVFQYDGNCVYDVKLLGHSCSEKKRVGALTVKDEEETKGFEEDDEEEQMKETYEVKGGWEEGGKGNKFFKEEGEAEEESNKVEKEEEVEGEEEETYEDKKEEEESYSDATEMDEDSDYKMEEKDDITWEEEEEEDVYKGLQTIKRGKHEAKAVKGEHHSRRSADKEEEEGKEVEAEEKEEVDEIEKEEGKKEDGANEVEKEEKEVAESYTDATEMVADFDCIMEEEDNSTEKEEKEEEKGEGEIAKTDKPVDTIASKHSCKGLKMIKGDDHKAKATKGKRRTTRYADPYGYDFSSLDVFPSQKILILLQNEGQSEKMNCMRLSSLNNKARSRLQLLVIGRMVDFDTTEDGQVSAGSTLLDMKTLAFVSLREDLVEAFT